MEVKIVEILGATSGYSGIYQNVNAVLFVQEINDQAFQDLASD